MSVQSVASAPKVLLETVSPGAMVRFADETHPRFGQSGIVQSPVDRGELTNRAGFGAGVWLELVANGQIIASYARAIVQVVAS